MAESESFRDADEMYRRAWVEARHWGALIEAVRTSRGRPLAPWVADAVVEILEALAGGGVARRRGGHQTWLARRLDDLKQLARFDCVQEARQQGLTLRDACEFAVLYLTGTQAGGGFSTMKRSFERVSRADRGASADSPLRYLVTRDDGPLLDLVAPLVRFADGRTKAAFDFLESHRVRRRRRERRPRRGRIFKR